MPRNLHLLIVLPLAAAALAACGRAGPPERPQPGVIVMQEGAEPAKAAEDRPFVLDPLL